MTVEEFLKISSKYTKEEYLGKFGESEQVLKAIEKQMADYNMGERDSLLRDMMQQVQGYSVWMRIHILSFCMKVSGKAEYAERLLEEVLAADLNEVGEYNKLSHYWQISFAVFQNKNLENADVELKLTELYRFLFRGFCGALGIVEREYIPIEQRNKNLVFVFASQVLDMGHAPTKTLLDRCYVLQKDLGKRVFIVNTAMQAPEKGQAPFYGLVCGQYREELSKQDCLWFRDEHFKFYQCKSIMPDLNVMAYLIQTIKRMKPYYLIDIGGSDICADLCGMYVPHITVSTVFSKIAMSCCEYQIADKQLSMADKQLLQVLGVAPQKVKRACFTFSFKEQTHIYSRTELGIWKDRFVLAIVGWRLDEEIDREFLQFLESLLQRESHIGIVFIGRFNRYDEYLKRFSLIEQCSMNLGIQEDVLAILECCDLYVNPHRNGGGSSVSEALYKGLPAVTLPEGDVSVAVGEQFWVEDYNEMEKQILRYVRDRDYYLEMAEIAKKRAVILMDSEASFGQVIRNIEEEMEKVW